MDPIHEKYIDEDLRDKLTALILTCKERNVTDAISIGNRLSLVKSMLPHGEWIDFLANNVGLSLRTCQDHMCLAKTPILNKYYSKGTRWLISEIRKKRDLSK